MKHIVALSGGKDSTAMALALTEREPRDYIYVCTPTANELPEMEDHWRKCEELLEKPLIRLTDTSLEQQIEFFEALPAHHSRWCTRLIKIKPYLAWIAKQAPAVSYVGLRADEEERLGAIYDEVLKVQSDYPMRRWGWGIADVRSYLKERGVTIPERTDCAWCYDQRLIEWWRLWKNYPAIYAKGIETEEQISKIRGFECTFRSPGRDTWPASMKALAVEFEKGRVPPDRKRENDVCRVCRI